MSLLSTVVMFGGFLVGLMLAAAGAVLLFSTENKKAGAAILIAGAILSLCPFILFAFIWLRGMM